jgi:hypothetical protein
MNGIEKRDMKCDKIIIDLYEGDENWKIMVVKDFGWCMDERVNGL